MKPKDVERIAYSVVSVCMTVRYTNNKLKNGNTFLIYLLIPFLTGPENKSKASHISTLPPSYSTSSLPNWLCLTMENQIRFPEKFKMLKQI